MLVVFYFTTLFIVYLLVLPKGAFQKLKAGSCSIFEEPFHISHFYLGCLTETVDIPADGCFEISLMLPACGAKKQESTLTCPKQT